MIDLEKVACRSSLLQKGNENSLSNSGLSISHVRRPGLRNLALGLANGVLNKSSGLVCPYLSNQWSESKV